MVVIQKAVYLQCSNEAATKYNHKMTTTQLSTDNQKALQLDLKNKLSEVSEFLENGIVCDFDSNATCMNILISYPSQSEVRLFVPNSNEANLDEELHSKYLAIFEDQMGNDIYEEFDSCDMMVGYLVDQLRNDNI